MEIVVLVKPVPEAETRLRPNAAGTSLDPEGIKWVLAGYDESAVEQALLLRESVPDTRIRAVSFGPTLRTEEVLRAAVALGCDSVTLVEHPPELRPDALQTAKCLAIALAKNPFDLLLAGKQSGDDEQGLVFSALAELLGTPGFGFVTDLHWDAPAQRFTFARTMESGIERFAVAGPICIGLQQAWNDPRTAKLPNILKSRKAPIDRVPWAELKTALGTALEPRTRCVSFRLPAPRTGAKFIEFKTPEEAAQKLVQLLREEAKVFP